MSNIQQVDQWQLEKQRNKERQIEQQIQNEQLRSKLRKIQYQNEQKDNEIERLRAANMEYQQDLKLANQWHCKLIDKLLYQKGKNVQLKIALKKKNILIPQEEIVDLNLNKKTSHAKRNKSEQIDLNFESSKGCLKRTFKEHKQKIKHDLVQQIKNRIKESSSIRSSGKSLEDPQERKFAELLDTYQQLTQIYESQNEKQQTEKNENASKVHQIKEQEVKQ